MEAAHRVETDARLKIIRMRCRANPTPKIVSAREPCQRRLPTRPPMAARESAPNATGRASGKQSGRAKRAAAPSRGEPFVQLTRELLCSPAWRGMSINCRRLIDFLLCDHMNHAGQENGSLKAPYDQLVIFGLTRSEIAAAVREAEYLRLTRVEHGGRYAGSNKPSMYELTFLGKQRPHPFPATNDWKKTTEQEVREFRERERLRPKSRRAKNRIPSSGTRITVVREPALPRAK